MMVVLSCISVAPEALPRFERLFYFCAAVFIISLSITIFPKILMVFIRKDAIAAKQIKANVCANICGAMVFALYFYMQTCGELLQMVSFFVAIPMAKVILDRMTIPVQIAHGYGYPIKELSINFLKFDYGVWSVLLIEAIRRIVIGSWFDGVVSIMLMLVPLLGYVFSEATGVCYTNVRNYKKGTIGFCITKWFLISVSLLMGSSWVFNCI
jgi:hypothetical protein